MARALRIWLGVAFMLTLLGGTPAAGSSYTHRCQIPGNAKAVVDGGSSVVYSTKTKDIHGTSRHYLGCLEETGKTSRLEDIGPDDDVRLTHFTLAAQYVAWVRITSTRSAAFSVTIFTFDLRMRRTRWQTQVDYEEAGGQFVGKVPALVLARNGDYAYVAKTWTFAGSPSQQTQVRARDRSGDRVLDTGKGIDPASLRLKNLRVSWTNAGVAKSAVLS
jgi:hypothetical protein